MIGNQRHWQRFYRSIALDQHNRVFTVIYSEVGLQIEAMIAFALPYVPGRDTAIHQRTERQLSEEPADRILTPSMS